MVEIYRMGGFRCITKFSLAEAEAVTTRPTVKVGQYKLRRGLVHQGVKDSIPTKIAKSYDLQIRYLQIA